MTLLPDIEDTGPTLRELLERGPLPIGLALEIAIQILREPDDLHALSPDNLRLVRNRNGSPVIRQIDPEIPGAGDLEPAEAPSDIHAFGVLLYELLTGVHPFEGHTSSTPLSFQVSDRQRRLPPELRTIVLTAIAEDPDGRFQSAPALAAELANIQQRHPLDDATREAATTVRPPLRQSRGTRLPAHPYGPPTRSILPRLLALGLMIAVLLLLWTLLDRPDETRIAAVANQQADSPAVLAEAADAEAEASPIAETGTPEPIDLPSDSPTVRTEPVSRPTRQARVETPRRSPAKQQPQRSSPRPQVAAGERFFASESAVPLSAPTPSYPEEALGTDTWAEIVVGLTIDETGAVRNPTIEKSRVQGSAPASLFHQAALAAARETRYRPAREQGTPVRSWTTLTFTFGTP